VPTDPRGQGACARAGKPLAAGAGSLVLAALLGGPGQARQGGPATEFPYPPTSYREDDRGQFHFSARGGWLNDVNAPLWLDGVYHLYFQHNPHGLAWDTMHWGHATSTDLVHWVQRPVALLPEVHPGDLWSGGGVVDTENASGLGTDRGPAVLVYSGTNGVQLFFSRDGGNTFEAYDGGRKIVPETGVSRDPQVVRDPRTRDWILTVWSDAGGNGVDFFRSTNLRDWTFLSRTRAPWLFECPQLQPMTVAGTDVLKWVLNTASGEYMVGDFDGTFVPDGPETHRFDHAATGAGGPYYAGLNFQDLPDGRLVSMAWQGGNAGSTWTGNLTFPVERTLVRGPEGLRVHSWPVAEIGALVTRTETFGKQRLEPPAARALLREVRLDLADLTAVFDLAHGEATRIAFRLHTGPGGWADRTVVYDRAAGTLDGVPLAARPDGRLELRMLIDRGQLALFANGGAWARSLNVAFDSLPGGPGLELETDGTLALESLVLHHLESAWTRAESTLRTDGTEPWYPAGGQWTDVVDGKQGSAGGDGFYLTTRTGTDFVYEADVRLETATAAALTFRADAEARHHYTANVDAEAGVVKLWRPGQDLATAPAPIERGRTYRLRVRAEGDHLQVWLDDSSAPLIDLHDATYARGQFGLNVFHGTAVMQDVRVRSLP